MYIIASATPKGGLVEPNPHPLNKHSKAQNSWFYWPSYLDGFCVSWTASTVYWFLLYVLLNYLNLVLITGLLGMVMFASVLQI